MNGNGNKAISKKRENTAQRIIDAIKDSKGLLTLAARKAEINYSTLWRYSKEFPAVQQAMLEAKEKMTDFAEGQLFNKIARGDTVAILFYLKTKGKSRGYIERYEYTGEGGGPVKTEISVVSPNAKKLLNEIIEGVEPHVK